MMKGKEFKYLRRSLGLSQSQLSKELDVTIRSITRWETDVNPIPKMAALALRYLASETRAKK
jgi:DNA-binding transcriptional regulator YiaG